MCLCVLRQRQKEIVKISVGAQAVNELLGGGIESRCITEIYGEFRSASQAVLTATPLHAPLGSYG